MSDKLIQAILHYQQNLERYYEKNEEEKMLHCINKLKKLPITVSHLEETGVGRTVNSMRKLSGIAGEGARALVTKWKDMVAHDVTPEKSSTDKDSESSPEKVTKEKPKSSHGEREKKHTNGKERDSRRRDERESEKSYKHERDEREDDRNRDGEKSYKNKDERDVKYKTKDCDDENFDSKDRGREHKKSKDKSRSSRDRNSEESSKKSRKRYDSDESNKKDSEDNTKKLKDKRYDSDETKKHKQCSEERDDRKRRKTDDSKSKHSKVTTKRKYDSDSGNDEASQSGDSSNENKYSDNESDYERSKQKQSKHLSKEKDDKSSSSKSKHKSSSEVKKSKHSESSEKTSKHSDSSEKTSDSSKYKSKSSGESSKSNKSHKKKDDSPTKANSKNSKGSSTKKKKVFLNDGIGCESGASFAEALGMLVPGSSKTTTTKKSHVSTPEKYEKSVKPTTSKSEPALLSNSIKLEPLDINISSLLPTISTNYKPLGNSIMDSPFNKNKPAFDDEALTRLMYSKNQRTKVYSGNKTLWGKIPSLFELCTRILQDNIDALEYTGGVPYGILKPVLDKATPDQLFTLEHHNPYLVEDSDELWQFHCNKEFRNKKREELESWREMYMRCLDEREAKLKALTANIKLSQDKSIPVRQTKLAYVDSVVKPPRNILKKQQKNGIEKKPAVTPSSRLTAIAVAGAAGQVSVPSPARTTSSSSGSSSSQLKPKKAPLMQKTLQLMKGRFRR